MDKSLEDVPSLHRSRRLIHDEPLRSLCRTVIRPKRDIYPPPPKDLPYADARLDALQKDLSEAITTLDRPKLERVIQIIHDGMLAIRNVSVFALSLSIEYRRDGTGN